MSMAPVPVAVVVSVLGYCILPIVMLSAVSVVFSLQGQFEYKLHWGWSGGCHQAKKTVAAMDATWRQKLTPLVHFGWSTYVLGLIQCGAATFERGFAKCFLRVPRPTAAAGKQREIPGSTRPASPIAEKIDWCLSQIHTSNNSFSPGTDYNVTGYKVEMPSGTNGCFLGVQGDGNSVQSRQPAYHFGRMGSYMTTVHRLLAWSIRLGYNWGIVQGCTTKLFLACMPCVFHSLTKGGVHAT